LFHFARASVFLRSIGLLADDERMEFRVSISFTVADDPRKKSLTQKLFFVGIAVASGRDAEYRGRI